MPSLPSSRPRPLPPNFFSRLQPSTRPRSHRTYNTYGAPPNESANLKVLYALMGANISIYIFGSYVKTAAQQRHIKPWVEFKNNMTLNLEEFRSGRWWIVLTASFTHLSLVHVFSNMFTVYFLGRALAAAPVITPARYLYIALGSGISGSLGWLASRYAHTRESGARDYARGVGFSGAIMGMSSVAACLMPRTTFYLYGIVPVPLWALVTGYAVYDGYYLTDQSSKVGHAGHLGGLGFGLLYYFLRLRGLRV